jgi:hypothetical protein
MNFVKKFFTKEKQPTHFIKDYNLNYSGVINKNEKNGKIILTFLEGDKKGSKKEISKNTWEYMEVMNINTARNFGLTKYGMKDGGKRQTRKRHTNRKQTRKQRR